MGIFYSPMTLIGLIKSSASITKELKGNGADWYFSKEGEDAYKKAKMPAQKTMYFFDYLTAVAKTKDNRDILYRTAYVMAHSMDASSLEFGGYPNILDSDKNPLVNYIKTSSLVSKERPVHGLMMLSALNHDSDAKKYLNTEHKPYTRIKYCESDGTFSDRYKIERDIIGAFCVDFPGQYMPPYMYEIVESSNDGEND